MFKQPGVVNISQARPSERRRFPRYYTDLSVRVRNQQEQEFAGRCTIVAEGGLGAILPEPIPTGSMVTLQFSIPPDATVVTVQAVVRNQKGLRHGFEFASLTDAEGAAISQFCSTLMTQSDDGSADL